MLFAPYLGKTATPLAIRCRYVSLTSSPAFMQFDPFLDSEAPLHPKSAVAAIILVDGDKYLLQHRDPKPDIFFPSHWSFFGGEAEPRETPIGTIRRELDEELGLRLDTDAFRYFTTFHFGMAFAGDHQIERAFYEVRLAGRDIEGLCPREVREWLR